MGLLDNPQDAALLQLGLGLLSAGGPSRSPVSLGQAIGSAGQGAMEEYRRTQAMQQQMQQRKMQEQMQQMQLQQAQRDMTRQTQQDQYLENMIPTLPAEQQAFARAFPKEFASSITKERQPVFDKVSPDKFTPESLAKFSASRNYADLAPIEKHAAGTELDKLISARDSLPEGHPNRRIYDQAINKASTHTPPIQVQNYPAPMAAMNPATGQTELVQFGNKGDAKPTGFKPALDAKPPTESEAKAALYASNMKAASNVLAKLEGEGMNMASLWNQADTMLAGGITNLVASPRAQKARQAQEQWAEAMLRMMTGAAATKDEITRNVKTYFPQPGDGPDVVAQKRAMRAQAEAGVFAASGRAQGRVQDAPKQERTVVRRGKYNGKTVVQYSDGSIENAD